MDWHTVLVLMLVGMVTGEETCLSGEENPYVWFGTKTAYPFVTNGIPNGQVHIIPGCRPIAFWLLARHGSHSPEANEISELQALEKVKRNIIENYRNGNYRDTDQHMCAADIGLLERWAWSPRHNTSRAGELSSEGYLTLQRLAQAWRNRFPDLLGANRHDYLFKYASDQRSSSSLRAFTEGLFGQQAEFIDIHRENDDKLLRPYKYCPAWTRDVEENNDTLTQVRIFESKAEYREMMSNISRRLGYNYDVDVSVIKKMYQMCRYNKAWDVVQLSPWCSVFTNKDLQRLEYAEDLETYYKYGYGSPLNSKISCELVKDMMNFFQNQVDHEELPQQPRARVHVGSAPSLLLAATALGAFRDAAAPPPTGDNFHGGLTQARRWRSSFIAPYAANLAAVLYRCNQDAAGRYQVLFLANEQPLRLADCRLGLCPWPRLRERLAAAVCDSALCNPAPALPSPTLPLALSLSLLLCLNFSLST